MLLALLIAYLVPFTGGYHVTEALAAPIVGWSCVLVSPSKVFQRTAKAVHTLATAPRKDKDSQ